MSIRTETQSTGLSGRRSARCVTGALACLLASQCTPPPPVDAGGDSSAPDAAPDVVANPDVAPSDGASADVMDVAVTDGAVMDVAPESSVDAAVDSSVDVGADASDAASVPDAPNDARIAACAIAPVVVPAGATMSIPLTAFSVMSPHPDILSCVSPSIGAGVIGMTGRVTLSAPALVTVSHRHGVLVESRFGIAEDCTLPTPMCLGRDTYPNSLVRLLPAGTYEIQTFTSSPPLDVLVEPPPPPPTNTTCATATDGGGAWTPVPRVADALPRFFRWRTTTGAITHALFSARTSDSTSGSATVVVRDGCSATANEVWRYTIPSFLPAITDLDVPGIAPNTTYYVEFSNIRSGSQFEFQFLSR